VWLQVLECCCADPAAHKAATRSLAQQLANHATSLTLAADKEQRLAELEQRVLAQQQQLATQQQQLVTQRDELSVQQHIVSQQQGEIVELRGQLAAHAQMMQLLQSQVQQLLHRSAKL
jgi:hypothetical protein